MMSVGEPCQQDNRTLAVCWDGAFWLSPALCAVEVKKETPLLLEQAHRIAVFPFKSGETWPMPGFPIVAL